MPENLTALMPAGELMQRALEAVNTFFWAGATGETTFFTRTFNPRVMLTVLTYSYATGVFSSAAIAAGCERDETLRYLSLGARFADDRIRLFRGQNMELVKRCLAFVIRQAAGSASSGADLYGRKQVTALLNGFRNPTSGQQEAERRIDYAIQLDREL